MAKQTINIGTVAGDGTGDPARTAFDKCNDNFDELYDTNPADVASGFSVSVSNPTIGSDVNERRAVNVAVTYDSPSASNPNFSNLESVKIHQASMVGQNVYGGGTNSKKTMMPLILTHTSYAAGQKFLINEQADFYGMGDSFLESRRLDYAGANIAGDEGTGWSSVNYLRQQASLVRTTISAIPTQATINTTTTQAITASKDSQVVTVASTTGVSVNQWVVIGQEAPVGTPNLEAVQVTAVGASSITGVFINNHNSGATVTAAKVLTPASISQMGEQRVVVNLSGTSYSTGTVASISGGGFVGSGTSWATNMVGGTATNIGAIALTADDYSDSPFDGTGSQSTLKSWYQIGSVTDTTHLGIHSYSSAGDTSYRGQGVSSVATYTIRPAARILRVSGSNIICETSAHTWTVGDSLECAIAPYPDVTGFQYALYGYTNGGNYRAFMIVSNRGARSFDYGMLIRGQSRPTGDDVDTDSFDEAIKVQDSGYGLVIGACRLGGIRLSSEFHGAGETDQGNAIMWHTVGGAHIMPNSDNVGMDFKMVQSGTLGTLAAYSDGQSGKSTPRLNWGGYLTVDKWYQLPEYAVAGVPSASTAGAGALIYVSNGNAGAKCAAMSDGTNWKVIALGATIAAS